MRRSLAFLNLSRYEIDDTGQVWAIRNNKPLRPGRAGSTLKYLYYHLTRDDGTDGNFYAHQLVLKAFKGPKPEGTESSHIDDIGTNNVPSNLEWETHQQNLARRRNLSGEEHPMAKLRAADVMQIRELARQGIGASELSARFGVHTVQIGRIIRGQRWNTIGLHWPRETTGGYHNETQ